MVNDWSYLFHTFVVGSLGYLCIIFLLRLSGKRTLSKWNSFDFVVTIAFGSILSTLLLSKDTSLAQGVLGFALLVTYQYVLTWAASRSSLVQKFIKGQPTLLLYQGKFQQETLLNERVTQGEILAAIRSKGVGSLSQVAAVVLETDGSFSVIQTLNNSSALRDVKGLQLKGIE